MRVSEIGWFTAGFHDDGFLPRYHDLVKRFQLDPKARLRELSKGQYAKVALALALAPDPEVLILDEPTSGLDFFVRREFLASMVTLAGEGRTIFISSHQIAEVERVASHVAFLVDRRLIFTATTDELRQRIVRLRLRYEVTPPDPSTLGTVLQRNGSGKQWQAIIQDPNRQAVEALRLAEGISEFEETALPLEEVYAALIGRKEVGHVIRVLVWKEYREQRAVWVAMAVVTAFLILGLPMVLGSGRTVVTADLDSQAFALVLAVIMATAYGLICGSILFAGEEEFRTLPFLDRLTGYRTPLWGTKFLAGYGLVLVHALFIAAILAVRQVQILDSGFVVTFTWKQPYFGWDSWSPSRSRV